MNWNVVRLAAALACAPAFTARVAGPAAPKTAPQADQWNWHGRIAAGRTLQIRGINGRVEAEPATGNEAVVSASKRAHDHGDTDEVSIQVVQHDGDVVICAVYPGRSNRCGPDDEYHMSTHDNDVEVDFRVQVPAGVRFDGSTVNGDVEADNIGGPVSANTVNGSVRLETAAGDASGETVNGSVTATLHGQGTAPLSFKTVNGGVTLSVPKDLNADLEAETVNGDIETDFPITVTGRINRRHLDGRIGQGGRSLKIETVNGSIRLRSL